MGKRRKPRLSKPGEHGGLVILCGSAALGSAVAAQPVDALVAGVVLVLGYMARGPMERRARNFRPREWDARFTVLYALLIAVGVAWIARTEQVVAAMLAGSAFAFPLVGVGVTKARVQRSGAVELIALTICGAVTGLVAMAGNAGWEIAAHVGGAMAIYGAATVGVVRSETRRLQEPYWAIVGVVVLLLGGVGLALANPWLAFSLGPRAVHALVRWIRPPDPVPIMQVAARESVELAGFVLLAVLLG